MKPNTPIVVSETSPTYAETSWGEQLVGWYSIHKRDLPWRHSRDPWHILISEIMLQQTRVDVVIPYYLRFVARFPSYQSMASAPVDDVLALWSGLGYYRRARSLHVCAINLTEQGGFPRSLDALLKLPGVGHYTAAAVASIAWDLPAVALDGNALRVLARLLLIERDVNSSAAQKEIRSQTIEKIPPGRAGDFTQAVMELGATLCVPRNPRCLLCPIQTHCGARLQGKQETLPLIRRSNRKECLSLQALILTKYVQAEMHIWLTRQHGLPFLKEMWLPPVWPQGDSAFEPWRPHAKLLGKASHGVTYRDIAIEVFQISELADESLLINGEWIPLSNLSLYPIPSFTQKILKLLAP